MTKLLVNFTRKIVYLLWLQNSGYIYSDIIIPINLTRKYSKNSFKIRRWQRYCLHNLAPFRFSLCMQAEVCIHVDTGFLLVMLCIRPFAKTSENTNKVESKGILRITRLVFNYFYKVSKKWRIKCTRC